MSLVLVFVFGCNSVQRLEEQWLGREKSVLIAVRGTPDQIMSDGFGGQIYSYFSYSRCCGAYGAYHPWHRPYYDHHHHWGYGFGFHYCGKPTKSGETMFWLDPSGKIYRVAIAN